MSFTPFARYRNFTLANLKALLEVYPDMARSIPWEEAKDFAEANLKGYKRTAYQQACQLGVEDRTKGSFRIHNYLYTFDDENLTKGKSPLLSAGKCQSERGVGQIFFSWI